MKTIIVAIALTISAWCQAATKTTAKDLSSFPLSSSGTISMSETVSSGLAHLSYSENLQTVNASAKPILMFVQEVTVEYSSGYRDVDRKEYERYFASRMLEPGETFQYGRADHGVKVLPVTNLTTSSPSCTIKTLFVQFADGSTFGDEKYASHILAIRKDIATALEHLNATYHDKGSKAFIQELNDTSKYSSDVNAFLDTHRAMFSQNLEAPPSAMNHVLGMIDRAESRRMLLAPTQQQ